MDCDGRSARHVSFKKMKNDTDRKSEYLAVAVARVLAQALSNIITANESLMQSLWETYMNLPEDQLVLMFVFYQ